MAVIVGHDEAWRRYEKRRFRVAITDEAGAAVNLTGLALEWSLLVSQRDTTGPLIHRSAGQFLTPEGSPTPNIAVWEVTDTESASIQPGFYWMELWDRTSDACLLAGNVVLLPGSTPYGEWIISNPGALVLTGRTPTVTVA